MTTRKSSGKVKMPKDAQKALKAAVVGIRYPHGLDKQIAVDICNMIRQGSSPKSACAASGVMPARFDKWYSRGKLMSIKVESGDVRDDLLPDEDAVCLAFYTMVTKALATAATYCAARIRRSMDWRAQAWRMDRVYGSFIDEDTPKPGGKTGPDGLPLGKPEDTKVVVYIPDNGRSTR